MASLYKRKDSPYWFIRYKTSAGQWKDKSTGYRIKDNLDTHKAKLLKQTQTVKETKYAAYGSRQNSARFREWCVEYITQRWNNRTQEIYLQYFFKLQKYLNEIAVEHPSSLTRAKVIDYIRWREAHGGSRNTALDELGLLRQLLKEAVIRNFCDRNEASGLGIKHEERGEKAAWADTEISNVSDIFRGDKRFEWMHVTFLFGLYQACRLQQCSIPVEGIDFSRGTITYPASRVKGGRPFTHRIDPSFRVILYELCEFRKSRYNPSDNPCLTCDIPILPSLLWRKFLDSLGYRHLCHHGLRVTWITRAALAGVPENIAMRFVNHSSKTVHRIYHRFSLDEASPLLDRLVLPDVSSSSIPEATP